MFPRITEYVHLLMKERIQPGDQVIDATMGNGHDTCFMAGLVGDEGKVFAYDIQQKALEATSQKLNEKGWNHRVQLYCRSHAEMEHPPSSCSFIAFNLGYLPGADKAVTTTAKSTIAALEKALNIIQIGGLISIVVYWGHEAGKVEKEWVENYVQALPYPEYMVLKYQYVNPGNQPPYVLAIERRR